jgi:glycosyltransferase involved in cell wall biosynthesis
MARIVFYTHSTAANLSKIEFYKQDIDALQALGHDVVICTKLREIPLRFDAMFIWWWTHALLPVLFCRLLRRPCIVTGTFNFRFPATFAGIDYFRRPGWQRILIELAVRLCTLNLFVSNLELQQCSEYFNVSNVGYMPHCVHEDYLQGPAIERHTALFNVTWSGKRNLIRKGIPELLKAIRVLKKHGERVRVYLAGLEGDGRPYLLDMIKELDVGDAVEYLGAVSREDKIRMLRRSEIYVQPSHYEGFGVAILEAMGCGACVIVRDVGAVKEVVGDSGLYVSSSDPEELGFAIQKALHDERLRQSLQKLAVKRARSLFTFEKKVQVLGAFLEDLQVKAPGPSFSVVAGKEKTHRESAPRSGFLN